jgi:hypothetical protein
MHSELVTGYSVAQEFIFTFSSQQQWSANVHAFLFQFLIEYSGNPSQAQLEVCEVNSYCLTCLHGMAVLFTFSS